MWSTPNVTSLFCRSRVSKSCNLLNSSNRMPVTVNLVASYLDIDLISIWKIGSSHTRQKCGLECSLSGWKRPS